MALALPAAAGANALAVTLGHSGATPADTDWGAALADTDWGSAPAGADQGTNDTDWG